MMNQWQQMAMLVEMAGCIGVAGLGVYALSYFRKPKQSAIGQQDIQWIVRRCNSEVQQKGKGIEAIRKKDANQIDWLLLGQNLQPTLLGEIYNMPLKNLTRLELSGNSICSIETLARVQFPYLQYLELSYNKITQIKPLRKLLPIFITWLQLHNNPLVNLSAISEFRSFQLSHLWIEFFQNDCLSVDDLSAIAKTSSNNLSRLHCKSDQRIQQPNLYSALCKKNTSLLIRLRNQ